MAYLVKTYKNNALKTYMYFLYCVDLLKMFNFGHLQYEFSLNCRIWSLTGSGKAGFSGLV